MRGEVFGGDGEVDGKGRVGVLQVLRDDGEVRKRRAGDAPLDESVEEVAALFDGQAGEVSAIDAVVQSLEGDVGFEGEGAVLVDGAG